MCNSARNGKTKSAGSGGSAAVFSEFNIVLHESNYYAKFQSGSSYFGRVACLVPKRGTSPLSSFSSCATITFIAFKF